MVRAAIAWTFVVSLVACAKDPPPSPPASGKQAPKGLPPADPALLAKNPPPPAPAADQALPANHPPLPPDHPPSGAAAEPEPKAHGELSPHGSQPAAPGGPALAGEISVDPRLAAEVKQGDTIYLIARAVDPAGAVQRTALAALRLQVGAPPITFKMDASNVMAAGAAFAGEVQLTARVDRDGESITRVAGDIEGVTRVKIPSDTVKIVLDTKVQP
jgi:hypothetical protein